MFATIGIMAHVDAGKTTLCEQILFRCGAIRSAGSVDRGNTLLDYDAIERRRGMTIYADQASFTRGKSTFYLLDTPGHADFSAEMERALHALDYAVIVVSCVEGVQAHTQMIWKLLQTYSVPAFFFLNKTDRAGADVDGTMRQIQSFCSADAVLLDDGLEAAAELLAERDEILLEHFLQFGFEKSLWIQKALDLVRFRNLFPCFSGSALSGEGVERFLRALETLTYTAYRAQDVLSAIVYKVRYDAQGTRVSYLKILSGCLHAKDMVGDEKIHEIRAYMGGKYMQLQQADAGQLCAVTGLSLPAGAVIGQSETSKPPQMVPLLSAAVIYDPSVPVQNVLHMFHILEAEDPQIHAQWVESVQQIQISVMGQIQLEVLAEECARRFSIPVSFGECEILYRETIGEVVYGCGHFEPLRHYAEVHLLLRPLPRGYGIRFRSVCSADVLHTNWQRLIETHVFEKTHRGALCGFPLTDVEVLLLTGHAHEKHTEGGDFRQAVYRAIRNALFHAQNILLEPFYRFQIRVPSASLGRVLSDLEKMHAQYDAPQMSMDDSVVSGRCPVSEMMNYKTELSAFTKGRGMMQIQFDGYDVCHNTQQVLDAHPYNREADVENTADSVFCAHGAGYTVRWDAAAEKMHCAVDIKRIQSFKNDCKN